jgi:hypothetical protein
MDVVNAEQVGFFTNLGQTSLNPFTGRLGLLKRLARARSWLSKGYPPTSDRKVRIIADIQPVVYRIFICRWSCPNGL